MKGSTWLVLAAVILIGVIVLAYSSGYQIGADIAKNENAASEKQ